MTKDWFEPFAAAVAAEQQEEVREAVTAQGYSAFYPIVEGFNALMKTFTDSEAEYVEGLLKRGRQLFPVPESFSPSWEKLWDKLDQVAAYKKYVFAEISPKERDGEWQVIMDNPYANQEIACYPALSFMEGAYLFAYFRPQLEKNEYIRLQKIQTLLMHYGNE